MSRGIILVIVRIAILEIYQIALFDLFSSFPSRLLADYKQKVSGRHDNWRIPMKGLKLLMDTQEDLRVFILTRWPSISYISVVPSANTSARIMGQLD